MATHNVYTGHGYHHVYTLPFATQALPRTDLLAPTRKGHKFEASCNYVFVTSSHAPEDLHTVSEQGTS
jgi:hypothetical protein